jgi:hypothetical protein
MARRVVWAEQIAGNVELWGQRALAGLKVLEKDFFKEIFGGK